MLQRHCQELTKKGKRCHNFALPNEAFCAVHLRIPPPPDIWMRVRAGITTTADIGRVISAADVVYRVIEFVVKHHPHFLHHVGSQDRDYLRLLQIIGEDLSDLETEPIDPGRPLDWAQTHRLYVDARQIAEEKRAFIAGDDKIFDDFNEWFVDLNDTLQSASAKNIEEPGREQVSK